MCYFNLSFFLCSGCRSYPSILVMPMSKPASPLTVHSKLQANQQELISLTAETPTSKVTSQHLFNTQPLFTLELGPLLKSYPSAIPPAENRSQHQIRSNHYFFFNYSLIQDWFVEFAWFDALSFARHDLLDDSAESSTRTFDLNWWNHAVKLEMSRQCWKKKKQLELNLIILGWKLSQVVFRNVS